MKKLALFFMLIMAIFCFFSCDQFTGPLNPDGTEGGTGTEGSGETGGSGTGTGGSGGVITYPDVDIELPTENKPTTDDTKDLLAEAVDLLLDEQIDEGIAKIKEAYADQKNNETALYYALAELASISVDPSVATLFKDNFGVKNYPATMNALISGDWMKEYPITHDYPVYNVYESKSGSYVRVSGDETSYDENLSPNGDIVYCKLYFDGEDWYQDYNIDYLTNISLDENGKYLVRTYELPDNIDSSLATKYSYYQIFEGFEEYKYGEYVKFSGTKVDSYEDGSFPLYAFSYKNDNWVEEHSYFTDITLGTGDYYVYYYDLEGNCNIDCSNETKYSINAKYKQVQEGTALLPEFNDVAWFKDTGLEEKFGSTHTAYSVMYLMLMNVIECNQTGLNDAIDNMLTIFSSKFANAKALASSITNASVEVPADVFDAFNLEELLDGQSDLKIGKAELNVLVASMEIIKGTLEWLSSYDWSLNVAPIKNAVI